MNVQVKPPRVRHEAMRIAGKKVDTQERIEVRDPYTGDVVGTVPKGTAQHARQAFAAGRAFKAKLTRYERQKILMATAEKLAARKDEIAAVITAESGLSMKDSLYEAGRAYDVFSLAGQLAIRDDGEVYSCDITPHGKPRKIYTTRVPLMGCISAITPFNHPLNMVAHKIAPAIATNNRIVVKPTEITPLTCLLLADTLYEAGLPPEMLSVVTGVPGEFGDAMITDPDIDLVTFTGSVAVGKYIASKAGYRRIVLELGGNDPLIVMEDADLAKAAELAVAGATKNSGQRCTAVNRILVVEKVAEEFAALVLEKAKKIKFGDPKDPDTDLGTVIHERAAMNFERRVNDAVAEGAKLLYGNIRKGALYSPTVVDKGVEGLKPIYADTKNPKMWTGIDAYASVIVFNTKEGEAKKVKQPKEWADLTDASYKGLIVMPNPAPSGTGYLMVSAWLQSMGEKAGWEFMDKLHQNVAAYTHSGSAPCVQAARGERVVGLCLDMRAASEKTKGAPLEIAVPANNGWEIEATALVKGTKNAAAAQKLIDWSVSKEAAEIYAKTYALVAHKDVKAEPKNYPAGMEAKLVKNDFGWMGKERGRILAEWTKRYDSKSEPKK